MLELSTASLSFLSIFIYIFIIFFYNSRRQHTPCPQSYPIVGNLIGFLLNYHRFHDWVADLLSQTPSSTLQVCTFLNLSNGICTANPLNVEHLLLSNFQNFVKGSRFMDVLYELLGNGIFNVDGQIWTIQRKIASHEFNTKSLKHFISETVTSEISKRLIPLLSKTSDENRVIDLQDVLQKFGFDNICNVAFGVDPACLSPDYQKHENTANLSFAKAFDDAVGICLSRFLSPLPLVWKTKRFLEIGSEKRLKDAIQVINTYAMGIIRSKEEKMESGDQLHRDDDLLSRFMSSSANIEFQDEEQRRKFLKDIVISFILAGRDSTSTALTWFFWLISAHPRCANLIHKELLEVAMMSDATTARTDSKYLSRTFNYDELKKLQYLNAALSESLRLFPPVPINSRLSVADDVLPDGTHVGKGWFADYSAYAMGRMEKVWGQDCREFKPERWLDANGVFQPSDQFRFPVFHCGPRMCLGKEMAYVQMKSVAAAVMWEFEITAVDGGGCEKNMVNPPYIMSLLLKMRSGLLVRLRRRKPQLKRDAYS
ncbi:Cytochrome P450, E-class, group I [Parasponia andersonii]|uniref:Cytochrome P450, E-class, group I n=1 Tax=Parasponia andersonii TaxID=3476 RepID=A0A2P5DR74_PARAD|nr:Cytochrome P450, E-class, group I [Parasponia andersonii]